MATTDGVVSQKTRASSPAPRAVEAAPKTKAPPQSQQSASGAGQVDFMPDLVVTWLVYMVCYLLRKTAPVVKTVLGEKTSASADCSFLICYAIGQLVCVAWVADWKPRYAIAFGLGASAVCCAAVPAAMEISAFAFIVLWGALGLCQALIHPLVIRLLGPLLENNPRRGFWMAVWCTSQSVGGAFGNLLAGFVLEGHGWKAVFFAPVMPALLIAAMVLCHERISNRGEVARKVAKESCSSGEGSDGPAKIAKTPESGVEAIHEATKAKGVLEILAIPGASRLALSYFFVKFVRYVMLLWLPYYHSVALRQEALAAAGLATAFELGATAGPLLFGSMSDMKAIGNVIGHGGLARINLSAGFLVVGAGFLALYPAASRFPNTLLGYCVMLIIGVLIGGPEAAMSSSMVLDTPASPQDLGQLAGVINGLGIVGAACTGLVAICGIEFFGVLAVAAVLAGIVLKFQRASQTCAGALSTKYLVGIGTLLALGFLFLGSTYALPGGREARIEL